MLFWMQDGKWSTRDAFQCAINWIEKWGVDPKQPKRSIMAWLSQICREMYVRRARQRRIWGGGKVGRRKQRARRHDRENSHCWPNSQKPLPDFTYWVWETTAPKSWVRISANWPAGTVKQFFAWCCFQDVGGMRANLLRASSSHLLSWEGKGP